MSDAEPSGLPEAPAPNRPRPERRRRLLGVAILLAGGALALTLARLPRDQAVRVSLGPAASGVREITLRYASGSGAAALASARGGGPPRELTGELLREVSFRYPNGDAPRVVRHTFSLPDGDYLLESELVTSHRRTRAIHPVRLSGTETTVDVGSAHRAAAEEVP